MHAFSAEKSMIELIYYTPNSKLSFSNENFFIFLCVIALAAVTIAVRSSMVDGWSFLLRLFARVTRQQAAMEWPANTRLRAPLFTTMPAICRAPGISGLRGSISW